MEDVGVAELVVVIESVAAQLLVVIVGAAVVDADVPFVFVAFGWVE